jgi:small multidrug resistance pump
VTYAIWSGVGIVLIAVAAAIVHRQRPDAGAIVGIMLIVAGVVVLNLFSNIKVH